MGLLSKWKKNSNVGSAKKADLRHITASPQNFFPPFKEMYVKQITLGASQDFTLLRQDLLNGNVMVVDIMPLLEIAQQHQGDRHIVQSQLQQIKNYCLQNGGSVLKIKPGLLLVTPNRRFRINH
jgi:SepF-like predicted cell division protein (DUF552 family)